MQKSPGECRYEGKLALDGGGADTYNAEIIGRGLGCGGPAGWDRRRALESML